MMIDKFIIIGFKRLMVNIMLEDKVNQMILTRMQQDIVSRTRLATLSAEQGNLDGLYEMGLRYLYGWGVGSNANEAGILLTNAADKGHPGACYELAKRYIEGDYLLNIPKDLDIAEKYITLGCDSSYNPNYKDFIENLSSQF